MEHIREVLVANKLPSRVPTLNLARLLVLWSTYLGVLATELRPRVNVRLHGERIRPHKH
jgi:hypothetical protein